MLSRCALAFWVLLLAAASGDAADRPNVVVFLADDAGWGDYGVNGNTTVRTPNIDSIAKQGVTVDRFFVCPVCAPTRAEFLTGRYHSRGGVYGVSTGQERLNPDEKTIADAFKAAGYATGAFGKWHNGSQWPYHPLARGFDEYFGHTSGHWGEYFDAPLEDNGRMVKTKGYIVDVCTDRALSFIDRHRERPFFCYIPFTTPHSPWAAPAKNWEQYKDKPVTQQATLTDQEVIDDTRCALAMVENQDANVGRVLKKLDDLKLADNTIIVYFSDNGPNSWRWNGGMKGRKASTDEGGVRSPLFIRWKGTLPAGTTVTTVAGAIDLLPTLTSLAGVQRVGDKPLDGRDLSPPLKIEEAEWTPRILFTTWGGKVTARTQTHRLDANGKLFDMQADPGQTTPVNESQQELAASLTKAVETWREEVLGDAMVKRRGARKNIAATQAKSVDPRPIHVGYREFPITMLPARDGEPQGLVKRSSGAPNCSYFVNWTSKDDRMVWNVQAVTTGKYEVTIDYTCPLPDAGSTIELSHGDSRLKGKVEPGWDPPLYTNQDTLPRPHGESQMKEFRTLNLGVIELKQGEAPLVLKALEIPGKSVMDVRRVTLTLVK
ncbi:Arylsulfatase [Caulifigura coniformis]|uniref:Arylsulfatase n=1 Tax=Caulifigura coniformis TaxID=2527983 RepID=A0A517SBZ7_9PLAN|nr:arylsulfatase [Caulifigura coniformis]QDT53660.1 Arylsulfatase [Caulifigura coniformis]